MTELRAIGRVLVTGAAGFIGARLALHLAAAGVPVRALVRDITHATRVQRGPLELSRGDVTESASLMTALADIDTVFHCAALVTGDALPYEDFHSVNVVGTQNLLSACRAQARELRVVHVSSVGVYGTIARGTVADEAHPTAPRSHYGVSKLAAEQVVLAAHQAGLPTVIARPMWVYGADSPGVVRLFRLIARQRMLLLGNAGNAIQPLAVDDLVDGLVRCATVPAIEGEIFNFAGPQPMATATLCYNIAQALGVPAPRLRIPLWAAILAARVCEAAYPRAWGKAPINREKLGFFITEHAYSIAKAARVLGWQPRTDFMTGASAIVHASREQGALR